MSTVYLLTHGSYDDRVPVAVFSHLNAAKASIGGAGWDEWRDGEWTSRETGYDIAAVPFGKLPDGWLQERAEAEQRDRELRDRIEHDRVETQKMFAVMTAEERRQWDREHPSMTTSSITSYQSEVLG